MKLTELGKTGIKVTPVGMGVLTIGRTQMNLPLEEGAGIVLHALERGINFLDTAQWYETYPYIKVALKEYSRRNNNRQNSNGLITKPVIASKSLDSSYAQMMYAIDECLEELELSEIDIFLLHEVREAPDFENRSGAWECLKEAKAQGIVKAIGISTHYVDVTEMCAELDDLDVVFPLINYKSMGIRNGSGSGTCEDMAAAIKKASEAGKGVFAMKAFGGGNLTGNYMEALNYVTGLPGMDSVMIGMGTKEDVDNAVDYAEGKLPEDYVPDISKKKIRIDKGDCECCGACIKICPNKAISFDTSGIAEVDHNVCITCGYCAPACPVRAIIMF